MRPCAVLSNRQILHLERLHPDFVGIGVATYTKLGFGRLLLDLAREAHSDRVAATVFAILAR